MKLIYVAGPYRGNGEWQVSENIRRAEALALEVWRLGAACICPHKNTAFFGGSLPDHVWLDGDLEIVRRCDAILCVPGWERSVGSLGEVALARELGIPVFQSTGELKQWLEQSSTRNHSQKPIPSML
jgi:hypothetical protein